MLSVKSGWPSLKRGVASLLLFALLTGGWGLLVSMGTADEGEPEYLEEFSVAAPVPGDAGVYDVVYENNSRESDGQVVFEWREHRRISLPDGRVVDAQVIAYNDTRQAFDDEWPTLRSFVIDPSTHMAVGELKRWREETEEKDRDLLGLSEGNSSKTWDGWSLYFKEGVNRDVPCGLHGPLQGQTVGLREVIPDPSGCEYQFDHLPEYQKRREEQEYREHLEKSGMTDLRPSEYWMIVSAIWEHDGTRFMEVEHWGNHSGSLRNGERYDGIYGRSWYEEDNPFPVKVERSRSAEFTGSYMVRGGVYTLVGSELADGRRPAGESISVPGERVVLAPRTPWMFDDSGVDHPFPASEAYHVSLEDPRSGLAEFLDEHPDAYPASGSFWEVNRRLSWRFVFTDGDEVHPVNIEKRDPAKDYAGLEDVVPVYRFFEGHPSWWDGDYPPPDEVPDTAPTVASMWAIWMRMASGEFLEKGPNSWRWELSCCGSSGDYRFAANAGRFFDDTSHYTTPLEPSQTYHRELSRLEWELSRTHLPFRITEIMYQSWWEPSQEPLVSVSDERPDPPPEDHRLLTPSGSVSVVSGLSFPAPDTAAAITLTALLVALGYYLFPTLKGWLLTPLFSRIDRSKALKHPLRRRCYETIRLDPGIHRGDLIRQVGLGSGQATHHLGKLVETGLLVQKKTNGYTCYFVVGDQDRQFMEASTAVRSSTARRILQALDDGTENTRCLGKVVKVTQPTVVYHLKRLRAVGLVEDDPDGVRLTQLGRRLLEDRGFGEAESASS